MSKLEKQVEVPQKSAMKVLFYSRLLVVAIVAMCTLPMIIGHFTVKAVKSIKSPTVSSVEFPTETQAVGGTGIFDDKANLIGILIANPMNPTGKSDAEHRIVVSAKEIVSFLEANVITYEFARENECAECHKQEAVQTLRVCSLCDLTCTHWISGEMITSNDRARVGCFKDSSRPANPLLFDQ